MKLKFRNSIAALGIVLSSVTFSFSTSAFADDLIYLTDPAGEKMFMQAEIRTDYFKLASYLESEKILTFCGPASMAAVLNSMDVKRPNPQRLYPWALFTQDEIFTDENQKVKAYAIVEHEGLVLSQIATFLTNLGVSAEYHHAADFTVAELREFIKSTIADPSKRLITNYGRKVIGQVGGGHISPAAAYDVDSDRVLILDVAKYKYPPVWIKLSDFHAAMMDKDTTSNLTRGIVVVSQ